MIESTIGVRRASYWQAILWKDLRLLTPSFVTIVVGALVIQMLQFLGVYLSNEPNLRGDASAFTMLLTYTAPVLIGMAAGGMLVGHERQTGTWNWNTSLPVVWWHALGAKLVVSFAGIMVAFAVLLIVPVAAYRVFEVNTDFVRLLSLAPYSLLVGLLTTLFLYLFALLLRETLTALVLGAMALAVCMIFATTMVVHFIAQSAFGIANVFNHPLYPSILLLVFAGLVALAGVVLMPVFRWRWQAGQHVEWRVRRRRRVAAHARQSTVVMGSPGRPSESAVLIHQSMRQARAVGMACVGGVLAAAVAHTVWGVIERELVLFITMFAILLLGVSVFSVDHVEQRIRFWSDRGAPPGKYFFYRLLPPTTLAVFCSLVGLWAYAQATPLRFQYLPLPDAIALALSVYAVGMVCGLCFRKTIIAFTVGLFTIVSCCLLLNALHALVSSDALGRGWLARYSLVLYLVLAIPFLFWVAWRQVQRWLKLLQTRSELVFAQAALLAAVVPPLIAMCCGFLMIPKVPWKGLAASELPPATLTAPVLGDQRLLGPEYVSTLTRNGLSNGRIGSTHPGDGTSASWRYRLASLPASALESSQLESRLDTLQQRLKGNSSERISRREQTVMLRRLLEETAVVTAHFLESNESDLAAKAAECNRKLRELAEADVPVQTLAIRLRVTQLWNELPPALLAQLGDQEQLQHLLLPNTQLEEQRLVQWMKLRATVEMADLQQEPIQSDVFDGRRRAPSVAEKRNPFLRWHRERALAKELSDQIDDIRSGRVPSGPDAELVQLRRLLVQERDQLWTRILSVAPSE